MKALIAIFIISIIVFTGGMALVFPESFNLCGASDFDCIDQYNENLGALMAVFAPLFLFISILVVAFRKARPVFNAWGKFAIIYLPLAAILIFFTFSESSSGIGIAAIDGEIIVWFLSLLFFFISVIILAVKSWKLRKALQKTI